MTRRSFITSALQALALVGAVKLGLGNMTAEDVRVSEAEVYQGTYSFKIARKRYTGGQVNGTVATNPITVFTTYARF